MTRLIVPAATIRARIAASGIPDDGIRTWPSCGTPAGYHKHRREAEPTCDRCSAARSAYYRSRRAATTTKD